MFLNSGGTIILHDCLPSSYLQQAIPRSQYKWTGDVWKAVVEMRTKEHLDTYTCNADMGLGIIFVSSINLVPLPPASINTFNLYYFLKIA